MADPFDPVAMGLTENTNSRGNNPKDDGWIHPSKRVTESWSKQVGDNQYQYYSPEGKDLGIREGTGFVESLTPYAQMAALVFGGNALLGGFGATTAATTAVDVGAGAWMDGAAAWNGAATTAATGAATAGAGAATGTLSSLQSLASIGSGLYGLHKANQLEDLAKSQGEKASPWFSGAGVPGSGQDLASDALKRAIAGDFKGDAGFDLAQLSAARTSAQQPGGYSASAAAIAALNYQNERIRTLSAPAGVGATPNPGTAIQGTQAANTLAGQSLGSIGFGLSGAGAVSPQLQALLLKYGLAG